MGLLSTEVYVQLTNMNIQYYEDLGYEIPRYYNKKKQQYVVKRGTKILVAVRDLRPYSSVEVDVQYDCCGDLDVMLYRTYTMQNHDGNLYCNDCAHTILCSEKNHPNWKPSKTQEEREKCRRIDGYDEFVKTVFSRDNHICQCCGKVGGALIAHHLDGYDWCKEKRVNPSNGICLCKTCHTNFHSKYGMGNNTKEQFEEWLGHAVQLLDEYNGVLPRARQVYCPEDDEVYNSIHTLGKHLGVKGTAMLYNICNHKVECVGTKIVDGKEIPRYAHYYTYKGKHYFWYDEYLNMSEEEFQYYMSLGGRSRKQVS